MKEKESQSVTEDEITDAVQVSASQESLSSCSSSMETKPSQSAIEKTTQYPVISGSGDSTTDVAAVIGSVDPDFLNSLNIEEIDSDAPLYQFGFDSITAVEYAERLSQTLSMTLEPTLLFQYPTLNELITFMQEQLALPPKLRSRVNRCHADEDEIPMAIESGYRDFEKERQPIPGNVLVSLSSGADIHSGIPSEETIVLTSAACRFPGDITNLESLWDNLIRKTDCIDEVPLNR